MDAGALVEAGNAAAAAALEATSVPVLVLVQACCCRSRFLFLPMVRSMDGRSEGKSESSSRYMY